ncbi:MAG: hypothetical protein JRE64_26100 [Deltaproteobacteria bacterium]|nr:hypothetical protein [Deltaproteobacteria bacterium]
MAIANTTYNSDAQRGALPWLCGTRERIAALRREFRLHVVSSQRKRTARPPSRYPRSGCLLVSQFRSLIDVSATPNGAEARETRQRFPVDSPATRCVPGTARILKGEYIPMIEVYCKSLIQPDGGEGCSSMATVYR